MIAAWMFYSSLCALGLAAAAVLAERVLLAGRGPVRLVWVGAVLLSVLVPAVAFRFAPAARIVDARPVVGGAAAVQSLDTPVAPSGTAVPREGGRNWSATLARLDQPLAAGWGTLSAALALDFIAGIVALVWLRRRWQRRTVQDVPVFVSERTGPAVVGLVQPAIVVPEWVLALEPAQLALMLRHEEEHRRAGDGRLLTVAQLALIAMPWNPGVWWQLLRLRVAVELDCDARVLQHADARSYGDLLLEMARTRRGPSLLGATAFAERAAHLERRIRVLPRHRIRTTHTARAMATCTGLAAVTVLLLAPRPPAPARAPVVAAVPAVVAAPVIAAVPDAPPPRRARVTLPPATVAQGPNRVAHVRLVDPFAPAGDTGRPALRAPARENPLVLPVSLDQGGQGSSPVDVMYRRLFSGIPMTPEKEAQAREILGRVATRYTSVLLKDQLVFLRATLESFTQTLELQAERDSALRTLLTNDADRTRFDAHVSLGGRGGRSGGGGGGVRVRAGPRPVLAGDTTVGGRSNPTWVPRSGGARGRGMSRENMAAMVDATFRRLFDSIALTRDQESRARAMIAKTQQDIDALPRDGAKALKVYGDSTEARVYSRRLMAWNADSTTVRMTAEHQDALLALVSNEADKATLRSRIVTMPPPPPRQPDQRLPAMQGEPQRDLRADALARPPA